MFPKNLFHIKMFIFAIFDFIKNSIDVKIALNLFRGRGPWVVRRRIITFHAWPNTPSAWHAIKSQIPSPLSTLSASSPTFSQWAKLLIIRIISWRREFNWIPYFFHPSKKCIFPSKFTLKLIYFVTLSNKPEGRQNLYFHSTGVYFGINYNS